jgi:streptogramin lyase
MGHGLAGPGDVPAETSGRSGAGGRSRRSGRGGLGCPRSPGALARVGLAGVCSVLVLALLPGASAALTPAGWAVASAGLKGVGVAMTRPPGAVDLGRAPARAQIRLEIALRPRDPEALARAVTGVSDPTSVSYRHYLAKGQFGPMFGPTPAAVATVSGWLRRAGMTVGPVFDEDLLLPVSGTVAEAEAAFRVRVDRFREASAVRVAASTSAPELPASVAPLVASVVGLDNLQPAVPASPDRSGQVREGQMAVSSGSRATQASARAACKGRVGMTPGDIARAYDFGPLYESGDSGRGEAVDLFELSTFSSKAVKIYQHCYDTHVPVQIADDDNATGSDQYEADSDIEDVLGLDPGLSAIRVYEADDTDAEAQLNTWGAIVKADDAAVVSTSFGDCEYVDEGLHTGSSYPSYPTAEYDFFAAMAMQGQSAFAASGDRGSHGCAAAAGTGLHVTDPASQPFVTAVGGTCFGNPHGESAHDGLCDQGRYSTTPLGRPPLTPPHELAWGQSGGGVSELWRMPSYQKGPGVIEPRYSSGAPCGRSAGYCREIPDVSADAETGYAMVVNGPLDCQHVSPCWNPVTGTSLAAPTWAALAALVDGSSSGCRSRPVGLLNPALYKLAVSAPGDFNHGVTSANEPALGDTNGYYPVMAGYNMVTGLGTPVGAKLAQSLCPRRLLHVSVRGSQVFGASPKLTTTRTPPKSVKVSGRIDCGSPLSLDRKSYRDSPTLSVKRYTVDAEDCAGLKDSDPGRYVLDYEGAHDGFVVSKDKTTTTLTVSHPSEPWGNEEAARFTIRVSTHYREKLPAAVVMAVAVGSNGCDATIKPHAGGGEGSCALPELFSPTPGETALAPGHYTATSTAFLGDSDLHRSAAASTAFTVTRDDTRMGLRLTANYLHYGQESTEVAGVAVSTGSGEELPATEPVTVTVGSASCVAEVAPTPGGGSGSCTPLSGDTALPPGTYPASAHYKGDADLHSSDASSFLTVQPGQVVASVSGSQVYGSSSPSFSQTNNAPSGIVASGNVTCGYVQTPKSFSPIGPTMNVGSYTIFGTSASGVSECRGLTLSGTDASDYDVVYQGVAAGFVVSQAPIDLAVSGQQTGGSSTPVFSETNDAPTGITVTDTGLTCTTVEPDTSIGPSLAAGSYTVLGSSCTGSTLSGSDAGDYLIDYSGVSDGFVVQTGIQTFDVPTSDAGPVGITAGPDGALWFTETLAGGAIGRVTTGGAFSRYATPTTNSQPEGIAAGPDGNLWFTEARGGSVAKITTAGSMTEFPVPSIGGAPVDPWSITAGPDDALWFTDLAQNKIDEIAATATLAESDIQQFQIPTTDSQPTSITEGTDGNLWFVEKNGDNIARMTPTGTFTEFPLPTGGEPNSITSGPDNALWFAEGGLDEIGEITTAGVVSQFPLPSVPGDAGADIPESITTGPDGNLWFTMNGGPLGQMSPSGSVTYYPLSLGAASGGVAGLTPGPDGNVWFTLENGDAIGEIGAS